MGSDGKRLLHTRGHHDCRRAETFGEIERAMTMLFSNASLGARPRILLARDNADMRQYVERLLKENYDVEAVRDGEEALASARHNPPDLVLADIMMPRLDGSGLLQSLRQEPLTRSIPVLLLSARAGEESRVQGLDAG